jgi:DNA polymerase-3 subunit epsilon
MTREIVLDTETTGLDPKDGHRVIELAAVELDGVRIGKRWHSFFDPGRSIDPGATAVHGISDADLKGQPKFADMADSFIAFIEGATLIAHNAPFDRRFIISEMWKCGRGGWDAEWIDTLPIARQKIPRKKHTLDDLCRHFGIRKSKRTIHGAMLDTILLAEVYVHLAGRFDQLQLNGMQGGECVWLRGGEMIIVAACDTPHPGSRPEPLPGRLTLDELRAHKRFIQQLEKDRRNNAEIDG